MRKILVATDLSPRADRAGHRAVRLAREAGASLRTLHVIDADPRDPDLERLLQLPVEEIPEALMRTSDQRLEERLRQWGADRLPEHSIRCAFGPVHSTIVDEAVSWGAELIVVGDHGHHFLRDLFIGTTAEGVIHTAPQPVLVVKADLHRAYRRVLLPIDFSDRSRAAVGLARRLAPGARLEVLHVVDGGTLDKVHRSGAGDADRLEHAKEAGRAAREAELEPFVAALAAETGGEVRGRVRAGHPPLVICDHAEQIEADLIVMGTRGLSHWPGVLAGGVARRVLYNARCDVALDRAHGEDEGEGA